MQTYRELFRTPEFGPLFGGSCLQVAAHTMSSLALGTLVFDRTGSALLAALSMFGAAFAQVVGAATLLSAADRLPPRLTLAGTATVFAIGTTALAAPGLPLGAIVPILLCFGLVMSVGGGARNGLLTELLGDDGYLLGRSVLNMSVGATQILGYAAGAALVGVLSPRGTLLVAAGAYAVAAGVAATGLSRRAPRAAGRPSVRETWRTNRFLWSSVPRRYVYLALWVPNGLVVGCEAVFVAYDPDHAGLLFAAAALGMLAGDTAAGRLLTPAWRARLGAPLRLLLAAPYLVFAVDPALPVAVVAVTVASIGFAASLLLQERLLALTPRHVTGQALGLHSSGMLALQGVGAAIAGALAQHWTPATAMALMGAASVVVTLILAPGLRTPLPATPPTPSVPSDATPTARPAGPGARPRP